MVDESNTQENDRTDDEQAEQDEEEILTEEQLEIQREIESLQAKIEKLDVKLNEFKDEHIEAIKREQLRKSYYSDEQIERYIEHIQGDSKEEIIESISQLKIPPANDNFADPSAFNGRAARPKTVDHARIGRQAYGRIKHKIFPWMRGQ